MNRNLICLVDIAAPMSRDTSSVVIFKLVDVGLYEPTRSYKLEYENLIELRNKVEELMEKYGTVLLDKPPGMIF